MNVRKVKKLIGSLLGAVSAAGVLALADALDLDVTGGTAVAVAGALAALGTWLAPANEDPQ